MEAAAAAALRALLLQVPMITFVFDHDLRLLEFGGGGFPIPERDRSTIIGQTAAQIVGPILGANEFFAMLHRGLGGASERRTLPARTRWYDTIVEPVRGTDGSVLAVAGVALNVSSELEALRALRQSEANLVRASRLANLAWWHYDIEARRLTMSDLMSRMYRFGPGDRPDREAFVALMHADDRRRVRETLIAAERDGIACRGIDYRLRQEDGSYIWVLQQIEVITSADGVPKEMNGTIVDITERKLLEEHLRRLAHIDGLTGLANRSWLSERLAEAFAHDDDSTSTALLYIDVDGFKTVNDTYGHGAGDELLKEVARRITSCLRVDDFVARSGGDEFVVLMAPAGDTNAIASLAERIVATCAMPYSVENRELFTSISIGASVAPYDATDPDALLRNADSALYAAKLAGRNTFRFYMRSMHAAAARQLALESDLRRAVERGELFLEYQPIVSAEGAVDTIEALARWRHPEFGLVEPSVFIPIAEQSGSIGKIGRHLAAEACRALRSWRDVDPRLRLALNISGYQLDREGLGEMLSEALLSAGLEHNALDIEVTESVVMSDVARAAETLRVLKDRGARISIDDFGTGYSSLAILKRLPIDTIKIDRSFISDIETETEDLAIIASIVALASALSLDVVAEGVERTGQIDTLLQLGCRRFQGYAFSRPVPAGDVATMLRRFSGENRHPSLAP